MSNSKLLITGASGFIGSHIAERALDLGYEVWVAVRRTSSRQFLTDGRLNFVELNLGDKQQLKEQLSNLKTQNLTPRSVRKQLKTQNFFDYVVHAAGATKCLRKEDFDRNNVDATRNLVEALRENGTMPRRMVFVSSLSLLGAIRETPYPYTELRDDDVPCPNTAYGASKLKAEKYLATCADLDYVVVRPTGVYGPRERDYFIMAQSIKQHIDFAVGYRPQDITFVYVLDLVQAIMKALVAEGVNGRTFIISDGETYNSRAFSNLLQRELGNPWVLHIKAPLWFLRAVCSVNGAVCHALGKLTTLNMDKYHILAQRNWRCDIEPARRLLGYQPEWPLERGVKATVAWYKKAGWL